MGCPELGASFLGVGILREPILETAIWGLQRISPLNTITTWPDIIRSPYTPYSIYSRGLCSLNLLEFVLVQQAESALRATLLLAINYLVLTRERANPSP